MQAEREIKYKSEKKWWEEQQKELAGRLAGLTAELDAYRGASKAPQLEERIQVGGQAAAGVLRTDCCQLHRDQRRQALPPGEAAACCGFPAHPRRLTRHGLPLALPPPRPQELEAALVQSEREKGAARAQLHELQLSMRTEGEFGNAGKRLRCAPACRDGFARVGWVSGSC